MFKNDDTRTLAGEPVDIVGGKHAGRAGVWVCLSGYDQCKVRLPNGAVVQPKRHHVRVTVASALLESNVNKVADGAGYVYVMRDQNRARGEEVKVGRAQDPQRRVAQLKTGNPHIEYVTAVATRRQKTLEETAHVLLAQEGVPRVLAGGGAGREWFRCTSVTAATVLCRANRRVKAAESLRRL